LQVQKTALICAVSREVLKGSAVNVQISLQQLLSEDLSLAVDQILLDAVAADAIRPAGLRHGVAGLTPSAPARNPTTNPHSGVAASIALISW
jgi:hypothetical protein